MAAINTATNVKLIYVAGVGPIIATIQNDTNDAVVVSNPCQFGLDEEGQMVIRDYLEGIVEPDQTVIFFKYNIVSVSTPSADIAAVYVGAIEELKASKPGIFVPDNKIIV